MQIEGYRANPVIKFMESTESPDIKNKGTGLITKVLTKKTGGFTGTVKKSSFQTKFGNNTQLIEEAGERKELLASGSISKYQISNQHEEVSETQKYINTKAQGRNNNSVLKNSNYRTRLAGDNSYNNQIEAFQKQHDGARSRSKSALWNSITAKPADTMVHKAFMNA